MGDRRESTAQREAFEVLLEMLEMSKTFKDDQVHIASNHVGGIPRVEGRPGRLKGRRKEDLLDRLYAMNDMKAIPLSLILKTLDSWESLYFLSPMRRTPRQRLLDLELRGW